MRGCQNFLCRLCLGNCKYLLTITLSRISNFRKAQVEILQNYKELAMAICCIYPRLYLILHQGYLIYRYYKTLKPYIDFVPNIQFWFCHELYYPLSSSNILNSPGSSLSKSIDSEFSKS